MNTLYWITVLGNINTLFTIVVVISLAVAVLMGIGCISCMDASDIEIKRTILKIFKASSLLTIVSAIILLFTPSEKQLYAIYGIGTVIDYAKESKEVQKLPDNAVKALNIWLENVNKEKKDSTNIN